MTQHMLELPAGDGRPARRLRLVAPPPATLVCAACNQLFVDPVILPDTGHTFCRHCVSDARLCGDVGVAAPVPNLAVQSQVGNVAVHCPNGKSNGMGCQECVVLTDLESHISAACLYVKASCPNNEGGGTMTREALTRHLSSCKFYQCGFHVFGCAFAENRELHGRETATILPWRV